MKHARKSGTLALAILASTAAMTAVAGEDGWYAGINVGESSATIDDQRIIAGLTAGGLATTSMVDEDTDIGFKIFGAYQFNKNFALEGGYFDLGEFGFTAVTVPPGTLNGSIAARGLNVDAVGILPFSEKFSAFGRIGIQYADVQDSFSSSGSVGLLMPNPEEQAASYKAGIGLEYDFTRSLGVRLEGERYRIDDAVGNMSDIDLLSLGLVFRFGGKDDEAGSQHEDNAKPAAAATPAPAKKTAPAPVLVVVPAAKKSGQYCSILDLTFEINQGDIQLDDKEKLAVAGTFMKKYPETTAMIEGHADNVGTPQHNLDLSQQRAESVANYLSTTYAIDSTRLSAVGYGDTRPIADNGSEEGKRANRRINTVIACATDISGLTVAPARTTMALDMEFDANSAVIRPEYADELMKVAAFMKANPKVTATVEGHTGNLQATPELAQQISQQRAQNVVNFLVQTLGVPASRLSAQGFGQTRMFAYNTTSEGQQENRRVNVIFTYAK